MVKQYVGGSEEKPEDYKEFKVDRKKVFLYNLTQYGFLFIALLILLFVLKDNGLSVVLEGFGLELNQLTFTFYAGGMIAVLCLVLIFLNYTLEKNLRCLFYFDRMVAYKTKGLVISSEEIHYKNVQKVRYDDSGVFSKIVNVGKITLELSGTKKGEYELPLLQSPSQVADYIQNLLKRYRSYQQYQYDENKRIQNIVDQEDKYK